MQQTAPARSSVSELEGRYLQNGRDLFYVVTHTQRGLRLEDCRTNLQTFYTFDEFQQLGLMKAVKPAS